MIRPLRAVQRPDVPVRCTAFALLVTLAPITAGCQTSRTPAPIDPARATQWSKDSAKYVQDSTMWVRDSVVIDSISRTINTDSVYRLRRAQLHADDPVRIQGLIECESYRLHWVYGSNAAEDARRRMSDTLYRKTDSADMKRVSDRLQSMTPREMISVGVGEMQCGRFSKWGPRHPEALNGTALSTRTGRPARPRRPGPG
jgi:hypothetical protein